MILADRIASLEKQLPARDIAQARICADTIRKNEGLAPQLAYIRALERMISVNQLLAAKPKPTPAAVSTAARIVGKVFPVASAPVPVVKAAATPTGTPEPKPHPHAARREECFAKLEHFGTLSGIEAARYFRTHEQDLKRAKIWLHNAGAVLS